MNNAELKKPISLGEAPRKKRGLLSAAELADAMPEFFEDRFQVLRLARREVIPCYVFPGTRRSRSGEFRFCLKEVRQVLRGYYQPAVGR